MFYRIFTVKWQVKKKCEINTVENVELVLKCQFWKTFDYVMQIVLFWKKKTIFLSHFLNKLPIGCLFGVKVFLRQNKTSWKKVNVCFVLRRNLFQKFNLAHHQTFFAKTQSKLHLQLHYTVQKHLNFEPLQTKQPRILACQSFGKS